MNLHNEDSEQITVRVGVTKALVTNLSYPPIERPCLFTTLVGGINAI